MTAYAPTWTGRLKISYFAAQAVHSQTWRYPGPSSGSGVTDLVAAIQAYYDALQPILWEDAIINAVTVADVNSPIFLPIVNPFTSIAGAIVLDTFEPKDKAEVCTFIGRTTTGNPWKISQFGVATGQIEVTGQLNFRVLASENVDIGNAVAALQAGGGTILGNDAGSVAIYEYANIKENDRWVKKVRRGA